MTKRQKRNKQAFTKAVAEEGYITVKPSEDKTSLVVEVHFCSIFLEKTDTMLLLLSLLNAARKVWPDDMFDAVNVKLSNGQTNLVKNRMKHERSITAQE